jgi:hypothetical protein
VAVLAAAVWFVLLRPSGPSGPTVALAMAWPKDRDVRYRMSATMDGTLSALGRSTNLSVSAGARLLMHAVSVDRQGVTTVRVSATHIRATANGHVLRAPNGRSVVRIASDGRMPAGDSLLPEGRATVELPGSGAFTPLPDHPVRLGESWTNRMEIPLPLGNATVTYTSTSRLVRYQPVGGVRAAVIETEGKAELDHISAKLSDLMASTGRAPQLPVGVDPTVEVDGAVDMFQTTWLDPHGDLPVKSSGSGTMQFTMHLDGAPAGQDPGPITMDARLSAALDRLR